MVRGQAAVAVQTLQSDLLAVPGVESAEVDLTDAAAPAGVRVRLAPDADARRVGVEVQRVLAAHGMRSRFSTVDQAPADQAPPPPPQAPPALLTEVPEPFAPPAPVTPPPAPPSVSVPIVASIPTPPSAAPPVPLGIPGIRSVSVEERADGLSASIVLADGRQASRAVVTADELDAAVVAAVTEATGQSIAPTAIEWLEVDGGNVVTVVLNRADGLLVAGAGVQRVGRAYAVAIATRSALGA